MPANSKNSKENQKDFNPKFLDIVKRQDDSVIHYGSDSMKSMQGNELSHPSPRFLEHIVRDLSIRSKIDLRSINGYTTFSHQKDYIENKKDPIASNFSNLFKNDPFIRVKFRRDEPDDTEANMSILDFLDNTKVTISFLFGCLNSMMKRLNDYFLSKYRVGDYQEEEFEGRMEKFFEGEYLDLKDEDRYALNIIQAVLAGQGGRLFVELRDKASLAYPVSPLKNGSFGGRIFRGLHRLHSFQNKQGHRDDEK